MAFFKDNLRVIPEQASTLKVNTDSDNCGEIPIPDYLRSEGV